MVRDRYVLGGPQQWGRSSNVCLTFAFLGAQKGAEMPSYPCFLGCPRQKGTKSEVDASALLFQGPKRGRKCYINPAFFGVPNRREPNQKWLPQPCRLRGPKEGGNAMSPLHCPVSPTKANKMRSGCLNPALSGAQKGAEMLRHPCILGGPQQTGTKSEVDASPLPVPWPKRGRK